MKVIYFALLCIVFVSCGSGEARRPVMVKTNTFLKESAEKNKKLLARQQSLIDSITALDTINKYISSQDGFKYYYITENKEDSYTPVFGDVVEFEYSLSDIHGKEIYSKKEKNVKTYYVDKEELFLGLRTAIKMLNVQEEAVFFFPSEIAFGYHGDKNKIGINEPIIARVHILKITKEADIAPENTDNQNITN